MSPVSWYFGGTGSSFGQYLQRGRPSIVVGGAVDTFVLGTTKPTSDNTGYDPTTIDGTLEGTQTISTAGTTIQNKIINGDVLVRATGVTLRNCYIAGRTTTNYPGYSGVVDITSSGCLVERCTIKSRAPAYYHNGLNITASTTVNRCDISYTTDMCSLKGSGSVIKGNYFHGHVLFDGRDTNQGNGSDHMNDGRFPGWSHNDCIQIYGGANHQVIGNNFEQYFVLDYGAGAAAGVNGLATTPGLAGYTVTSTIAGAAAAGVCANGSSYSNGGRKYPLGNYDHGMLLGMTQSLVTNLLIDRNWYEGGEVAIQITAQGSGFDSGNTGTITGNRFGLDLKAGYTGNTGSITVLQITAGVGTWAVDSTNIFDPTRTSVPDQYKGQPITNYPSGASYGRVVLT